jgi:hypothetical protein
MNIIPAKPKVKLAYFNAEYAAGDMLNIAVNQ